MDSLKGHGEAAIQAGTLASQKALLVCTSWVAEQQAYTEMLLKLLVLRKLAMLNHSAIAVQCSPFTLNVASLLCSQKWGRGRHLKARGQLLLASTNTKGKEIYQKLVFHCLLKYCCREAVNESLSGGIFSRSSPCRAAAVLPKPFAAPSCLPRGAAPRGLHAQLPQCGGQALPPSGRQPLSPGEGACPQDFCKSIPSNIR